MDLDLRYLETLSIVFQDLECFILQKMNQNTIYALLQIKKTARRNNTFQLQSVDKKSKASQSKKNYSSKKSEISDRSDSRSQAKQSHVSSDLINCAQNFNGTRRKAIHQKLYTQTLQPANDYFSAHDQQNRRYSNLAPLQYDQTSKVNIVPKLVGLGSSQQISDIEQPFGNNSREKYKNSIKNYDHSIAELDDDDDQFEDIILNRLGKIQQKVTQMLRNKNKNKISTHQHQPSRLTPAKYHLQNNKLQTVGSGGNIIYTNQLRQGQFYKQHDPRNNKSATFIPQKHFTFQNSKNNSVYPSSKKNSEVARIKQNLTERINNPSRFAPNQNYMTDQQQDRMNYNLAQQNRQQENNEQIQCSNEQEAQQFINKSKRLGKYRQSQQAFHQIENLQKQEFTIQKQNRTIDYQKLKKEPVDESHALKYIPLSKLSIPLTSNENRTVQQKTQRQIPRRQQIQRVTLVSRNHQKYEQPFQERLKADEIQKKYQNYKRRQEQAKFRSGKSSAVRANNLQNSGVKAYSQQGGDFSDKSDKSDQLSISSQKKLYSQIQKLRQITKQHGQKKQNLNMQHQRLKAENQYYDYRHLQKTERPKYSGNGYSYGKNHQEEIIIQGEYPIQTAVRVVKPSPYYYPRQEVVSNIRNEPSNYPNHYPQHQLNQPIYVSSEQPVYYNQRVQSYEAYQVPNSPISNIRNYNNQNYQEKIDKSSRKFSTGSLNSFKSIPYYQGEMSNPSRQYMTRQRSVKYVVENPVYYVQNGSRSQYSHQL